MNTEVSVYIECLTSLRYHLPFLKQAINYGYFKSNDVMFYYTRLTEKYNRFLNKDNFSIFNDILKRNGFDNTQCIDGKNKFDVKSLFCVEFIDRIEKSFSYKKCYAFTHGFDFLAINRRFENQHYITANYFKGNYNFNDNDIYYDLPVVFWDYSDLTVQQKNECFIFYPEEGYNDIVEKIVNFFDKRNVICTLKQRRKSQKILHKFKNRLYDDIWYPSESITYPIQSRYIFGFNTSALMEFVIFDEKIVTNVDSPFMNIAFNEMLKKFSYDKFMKNNVKIDDIESYMNNIIVNDDILYLDFTKYKQNISFILSNIFE